MLVCVKINSVIAQKIRVYRLGTSPNQLWNGYLASGDPMNQDSECQMDEGRSRRWGTSCFRFIRSLSWHSKGGRVERVKRCAGIDMKGESELEAGSWKAQAT